MAGLRYSRIARRDLDSIWDYIAADNPPEADEMLRRIDERCHQLAESPELGERWPQLAADIRMFTVGSYVIFYRPAGDGIEVARILHSARDIPAVFRQN